MFRKIDTYIFEQFQYLYNYLLDNFGCMKGTLTLIFGALSTIQCAVLWKYGIGMIVLILLMSLTVLGGIGWRQRTLQLNKNYMLLNAEADVYHCNFIIFIRFFIIFFVLVLFGGNNKGDALNVAVSLIIVSINIVDT